jgi:sigma-B regulation protein RsbU (phosphoserine phosphatase)
MLELKDKLLAHDELAAGRVVQFALMPKDNPDIAGWNVWLYTRPANEVSGDMVDYIWISKNRLGLALGDVAGKGLGAAMFMAKLQATLRALAPMTESLTKLGKQINTIFCRDGLPSRFISLIYIELQPDSDKIRILNAGHIPPICIQKNNMKELEQGGLALGLHPESRYEEQDIVLHRNDLLVVYSDGLTEARNEKGAFFGEQKAQECIQRLSDQTAGAIGEQLLSEVNRFVGQARQSDDLSLIVLKRK